MSTPPINTSGIDEVISEVKGLEKQVSTDQTTITGNNAQIAKDTAIIQNDATELAATKQQLSQTQNALIAAQSILQRKPVIYSGIEKFGLFVADKKIPFQWIQPGNTGNTGGGSSASHGSETWVPGPGGTIITATPKNIAPASDNFDNYMVLPFPAVPPRRQRTTAKNYSCKTPADWALSQQLEGPVLEYIGGGFQSTCAWRFNPHTGLGYWNGSSWVTFLVNGSPVMVDMGQPTMLIGEYSLDQVAHTFTYEWVVINGICYPVGVTVPAVPFAASANQWSVAVQLDCQAGAPVYSAILDGLSVEWQ